MNNEQLIQSEQNLRDYFFAIRNEPEKLRKGVMVSTAIRKETLTSIGQGGMVLNGRVIDIQFVDLSGGVWQAYIDTSYTEVTHDD
jgi:hypothetical protein